MNSSNLRDMTIYETLYFISMVIANNTLWGGIRWGFKPQIIIGIIWICIFFINMCINKFKFPDKEDIKFFLKLYVLPLVVIHAYTIVLMILGIVNWSNFTTNMKVYIPAVLAVLSVYFFKKRAMVIYTASIVASWFLSVFITTMVKGVRIWYDAVMEAWIYGAEVKENVPGYAGNFLELHDIALSLGYILIYHVFSNDKISRRDFYILNLIVFVMLFAMKRIAVLGIVIAIFFYILIKKRSVSTQYKFCKLGGLTLFFIGYGFIYIISSGESLYDTMDSLGIDMRGRSYYYSAIMEYASFSPKFLGVGRNAVSYIFSTELSYLKVGGTHSDIIKSFIENGFLMFGWWLWYYFINIPKKYKSRYGEKYGVLTFGIMLYSFVLYLTDNTENYFVCQMMCIIAPMTYSMYSDNYEKRL